MALINVTPRRLWVLLGLAATFIGCQTLLGSAQPGPRFAVLLSDAPSQKAVRQQFLRGFAVGEDSVRRCGVEMPAVAWLDLPDDQSPVARLQGHSAVQMVVAPPATDLRAFDQLADQHQVDVLLPYQRGRSLETLRSLDNRHRLWPLTPSRLEDLKAVASTAMDAGWGRAMVVADPAGIEATDADSFVTTFKDLGGVVESYDLDSVQRVDPADVASLKRFRDDMAWSWVQTVIVAGSPDSDLVKVLQHQQSQGDFGGGAPRTPNWVWLSQSDQAEAIASQPWQQITLTAPARGQHWDRFAEHFRQRWQHAPGLLEASAYDTARVLALADGDQPEPMAWIDPDAEPMPLCEALRQRQAGQTLKIPSAASDFRLRAGYAPGGIAEAALVES